MRPAESAANDTAVPAGPPSEENNVIKPTTIVTMILIDVTTLRSIPASPFVQNSGKRIACPTWRNCSEVVGQAARFVSAEVEHPPKPLHVPH